MLSRPGCRSVEGESRFMSSCKDSAVAMLVPSSLSLLSLCWYSNALCLLSLRSRRMRATSKEMGREWGADDASWGSAERLGEMNVEVIWSPDGSFEDKRKGRFAIGSQPGRNIIAKTRW